MSGFSYEALAGERAKRLVGNRGFTLLAIETSCDETAASVLTGPRNVLGSAVHTQIPLHVRFGGVVPEIASRSHVEAFSSAGGRAAAKLRSNRRGGRRTLARRSAARESKSAMSTR